MEPSSTAMLDWMSASVNILLNFNDLTKCRAILQDHEAELAAFFGLHGDETKRILFVWKTYEQQMVEKLITVMEPGMFNVHSSE